MKAGPIVRGCVAVAVLVLLVDRLGTRAVLDGLRSLGPGTFLAALSLGAVVAVTGAARWWLVSRALGAPVPLRVAVADIYRAQLLNSVLPAGLAGDAHRAVVHGLPVAGGRAGFRAVVLERVGGQVVVVLALLILLAVAFGPIGIGCVLLAAVLATAVLARYGWAVGGQSRPGVRGWCDDARTVLLSRDTGPGVALLSLVALACHLALFVVAARVAGVTAPLGELLPLLAVGLLSMSIPLNVGGWGPREGVTAAVFGAAGLHPATGFAVAVLFGVLGTVSVVPGVLTLARSWGASRMRPRPTRGSYACHESAQR